MYSCAGEGITGAEREALILASLPQVRLIARKIHETLPDRVSLEDLVSSGVMGLIAAIDHFDPNMNVKLRTYAEYRIRGAILDTLRGLDWAPRQKRRLSRQIELATEAAERRLGRVPSEDEIAEQMCVPLEEYRRRVIETEGLHLGELEFSADRDPGDSTLMSSLADAAQMSPAQILERSELERLISQAIERMPRTERLVLSLYYEQERNLREIAELMDLHLSRISQLKTQGILRLRNFLESRWPGRRTA